MFEQFHVFDLVFQQLHVRVSTSVHWLEMLRQETDVLENDLLRQRDLCHSSGNGRRNVPVFTDTLRTLVSQRPQRMIVDCIFSAVNSSCLALQIHAGMARVRTSIEQRIDAHANRDTRV